MSVARQSVHHLVNLVYRPTRPEGASKDHEFSRRSWKTVGSLVIAIRCMRFAILKSLSGPPLATRAFSSLNFPGTKVEGGGHHLPRHLRGSHPDRIVTRRIQSTTIWRSKTVVALHDKAQRHGWGPINLPVDHRRPRMAVVGDSARAARCSVSVYFPRDLTRIVITSMSPCGPELVCCEKRSRRAVCGASIGRVA